MPEDKNFILDSLCNSGSTIKHYGRVYKFLEKTDNAWSALLVNDTGKFSGEFKYNLNKDTVYFAIGLEKQGIKLPSIEFVERSFHDTEELTEFENNYFLNGDYKRPAVICIEEFNLLDEEINQNFFTGKISTKEYLKLFAEASGINYNDRIRKTLEKRGESLKLWFNSGHSIKRPVFYTRKDYHDYEEKSTARAEQIHHETNRLYKTIEPGEVDFNKYLELSQGYILGVLGFSHSRIRDNVTYVVDYLSEYISNPEKTPERLSFLISPSSGAFNELKNLYGNHIELRQTNLEKLVLAQNGIKDVEKDFNLDPLKELRIALLSGQMSVPDTKILELLSKNAAYSVLRKQKDLYPNKTSLVQLETDYYAARKSKKLAPEFCRKVYQHFSSLNQNMLE